MAKRETEKGRGLEQGREMRVEAAVIGEGHVGPHIQRLISVRSI